MIKKMMPLDCNKMYSNLSIKKKTRSYILRTDIQNFYVHHETDIQQNIVLKIELRHGDKERDKNYKTIIPTDFHFLLKILNFHKITNTGTYLTQGFSIKQRGQ